MREDGETVPPRWLHEGFDIVALGRSYWRLHKGKDAAWRELGPEHRAVGHDYYPLFQGLASGAPFPETVLMENRKILRTEGPDRAEEFQAYVAHDYLDRWWDDLSSADRRAVAAALREMLLNPAFLLRWAGVDVVRGLVKVRYGLEDGYPEPMERWEPEPSLPEHYRNLREYLESRSVDELLYLEDE